MAYTPGPHPPAPPVDEAGRLRALHALGILDTAAERAYDDVTLLAAQVVDAPIALVTFIDAERQWFKSRVGTTRVDVDRRTSFCTHAIRTPDRLMTVPDARADPRFVDSPFVAGAPHVRFYAGVSIVTPCGQPVGTVCVMDPRPRTLAPAQASGLAALARQAERLVAARMRGTTAPARDTGERERIERALVESERRIRTITDNLPALIAHIDRDGRYTFANAHLGHSLGQPVERLVGQRLADVVGDRYARIEAQVRTALDGKPVVFDWFEDRFGRRRHLQSFFVPDFDGDGRVDGFYAMTLDVTERKEAELRQAETEARLRGITDALPALIAEIDPGQRFRFCNRTYRTWLGVDHEAVIGRRLVDVLDPAYFHGREPFLARALAGEAVSFEQTVDLPIGTRTLQTTYLPHGDGAGAVGGIYAMTSDITALKDVEHRLDLLARIDPLTGLANRRQFEEHVGAAMARTRRSGEPMAVVFLDVDHFKAINDSLGHAAGDAVLKVFADRLMSVVRQSDTVARYAGDEFVVVLEQLANVDEGGAIADKLVVAMRRPFEVAGATVDVTTSAGVAAYTGGEASPSKLLSLADQALYRAKSDGRDRMRVAA